MIKEGCYTIEEFGDLYEQQYGVKLKGFLGINFALMSDDMKKWASDTFDWSHLAVNPVFPENMIFINKYLYFYRYSANTAKTQEISFDASEITMLIDGTLKYETAPFLLTCGWKNNVFVPETIRVGPAKKARSIKLTETSVLNPKEEIREFLKGKSVYAFNYAKDNGISPEVMLIYPQIEQLCKSGFAFAEEFLNTIERGITPQNNVAINSNAKKQEKYFCRLTSPGTNLKNIFTVSKPFFTAMKKERDLEIWDVFRKMSKTEKISDDIIIKAIDKGYSRKELEEINTILNCEYDGKKVFTWDSLMTYLDRLDAFEAIDFREAVDLLRDYLTLCRQISMKPRIDGDSLKREHDIAARISWNMRNDRIAKQMIPVCKKMAAYDYSEGLYSIRAVRDYDDLVDEAKQQHNCVAAYGDFIAKGTSYIFVLRETNDPDRSLVTVELDPRKKEVRQKYLAYNKPVRNKSITEFLDRWVRHVRTI